MKPKKTSKSNRARKATKDLSLADRGATGTVKGGDLRAVAVKVENNMAEKEQLRKAQALLAGL